MCVLVVGGLGVGAVVGSGLLENFARSRLFRRDARCLTFWREFMSVTSLV